MPSVIPDYEYDIFISYRQKDNKGGRQGAPSYGATQSREAGWVSEFVDALKDELESTFKEQISVYFDINPHDGLLETHDVDASLEKKLKCLVFIPVISRTYCDPNSFAWEHEFRAFIELASHDQFGLKVSLPGGNVANRVLPVRIHDLDSTDIKLFESTLGGVLRSIDFVHKETGVNRQLRPKDDNIIKGANQIFYRDQINKVALAVKDIIESLKNPVSSSQARDKEVQIKEITVKTDSKSGRETPKKVENRKINGIKLWKAISGSLAGLLILTIITYYLFLHESSPKPVTVNRLTCVLPKGDTIYDSSGGNFSVALSPDGNKLAFVALRNDTTNLYLRYMDEFESKPISGTEFADGPFFSPDNKWLGFFANGTLKKVSVLGGAPQNICEAKDGYEGYWCQDNNIIYEEDFKGIMQVPSTGGIPKQLTSVLKYSEGRLDQFHLWPQLLPGGKIILFTSANKGEDIRIEAFSLETGKKWNIIGPGSQAQYIKPGYLVYAWKGNLFAVPFNLKQMKVTGQPVVILQGVWSYNNFSTAFTLSHNGSLAYIPGDIKGLKNRLVLVDNNGRPESLNFPAGIYLSLRFSPDGKNILNSNFQEKCNLWIYGLERGTISRFSEKERDAFWGIWSPDGKRIVFNSELNGSAVTNLFWKRSDGSGQVKRLTTSNYHQLPKCWSADSKYLIFTEGIHPETGIDICLLTMDGDSIPRPFLNTRFNEIHPALSPDGRWLAYASDEPGQYEVFVCSFPGRENLTQISTAGGSEPLWAPDGKQLYYRDITGQRLMSVSFVSDSGLQVGKPVLVFQGKYSSGGGPWGRGYDITPDGKKFLMVEPEGGKSEVTQINIILNWFEELKQKMPVD